jgi:hypothetical protein
MHNRGGRYGREGGANDDGTLRETRQSDAGQVGGEQRADGRPDCHAHPADDLGRKQEPQGAALDTGVGCFHLASGWIMYPWRSASKQPESR